MNTERIYEMLRSSQEPQGYFFNKDRGAVDELLASLLINKGRYGYMSCPCRLAAGDRGRDSDIICPCVYREADVKEYGSCYCALYVSKEWNRGEIERSPVPERRPPEKLLY